MGEVLIIRPVIAQRLRVAEAVDLELVRWQAWVEGVLPLEEDLLQEEMYVDLQAA